MNADRQVVMFADVVGSTRLYEDLGDTEAQRIVAAALDVARTASANHAGVVATELGDEIMVLFREPGDAAAAACEIHATMTETELPGVERAVRMRIGMHYGPMAGDDSDLMGETVKIAHWAASNAKPEQTLSTAAVVDTLPRIFQAVSRFVDDETWNFVSIEHLALHEIIWDVEGVTAYSGEIPTLDSQKCRNLTFRCGRREVTLDADRPVISVGRGAENDLVVAHELASRQHLSAQFSRGRCTITDNSTNGTTVFSSFDRQRHDIRRESFTLMGAGRIVLGQPDDVPEEFVIHYEAS